ncbi:MAG: hypothetical protein LBE36_11120 [Flavobacteriaceae bacterium]|jgi:hypothetical protein|nr:hypothetical protein [Flavobacteriaceae bacterium]
MKQTIGILLLILLSFLSGIFFVQQLFYIGSTHYGYLGYCNSIELPYFEEIYICGVLICIGLTIYYIYVETFAKFEQHKKFYPYLLFFLLIFFMHNVYGAIKFPFVARLVKFHFGQSEGGGHNPLFVMNTIYSIILIWLTIRFQIKTHSSKIISIFSYLCVAVSLMLMLLIYWNAEYEVCRG